MSCVDAERDDSRRPGRQETSEERADRNLIELLQELRVIQTGVQIVFAFLLGLAFTSRFPTSRCRRRGRGTDTGARSRVVLSLHDQQRVAAPSP